MDIVAIALGLLAFLLLLADLVLRQLTTALNLLGMDAPEMM